MEIMNLPISSVKTSPMNPRKTFEDDALQELADNIRHQGLLQPITVRPMDYDDTIDHETGEIISVPVTYEVVCGERRYRACVLNGAETISAIVREMSDDEAFDAMITENLQRKDVDPIEEAYAFGQLITKGATAEEIAARFGKSTRFVQDRIKLNNLIPELLVWVRDGKLPLVSAMIVAKLDEEHQTNFAKSYAYNSSVPKETALNFVNNLFCFLSSSPWHKEPEPFTGGCGIACGECKYNSSNAGCLFWEMKSDPKNAKCTNREKMEEKAVAYFRKELEKYGSDIVAKGGRIEKGKIVLVDEGARYYSQKLHEKSIQLAKDMGYEVFSAASLGDRCWYQENDERTVRMLESGDLIKGFSLQISVSGNSVTRPLFFYTKTEETNEDVSESTKDSQEAIRLAGQYADVESGIMSGAAKALVKQLRESETDKSPLRNNELAVLALLALLEADNETKRDAGLENCRSDAAYKLIISHPEKWGMLLRKWMYAKLQETFAQQWKYSDSAVHAIRDLAEEALPEEYEKTISKAESAIDKKRTKLAQLLSDLGYGTDGKLLEYKDDTHYAQD